MITPCTAFEGAYEIRGDLLWSKALFDGMQPSLRGRVEEMQALDCKMDKNSFARAERGF